MAHKYYKVSAATGKMISLKEILLKKGIADDYRNAESLIMSGKIKVDDKIIEKPGFKVPEDSNIEVIKGLPYVSRGGLKIEGAFTDFKLDAKGKKIIDIGASTGGFTDYLLKKNASRIVAVDVGYGILAWKLRTNPAVTVFERTNIRYLDVKKLPYLADLTVVDVSFISIKKIFDKLLEITRDDGEILILVKPQFEAGRSEIENKGVIKSRQIHKKVLVNIFKFIHNYKLEVECLTFSRIKGAKGNIEYWIYLKKQDLQKEGNNTENQQYGTCIKSVNIKKTELNYDKIIDETIDKASLFFN